MWFLFVKKLIIELTAFLFMQNTTKYIILPPSFPIQKNISIITIHSNAYSFV